MRLHAIPRIGFPLLRRRNPEDGKTACRMQGHDVDSSDLKTLTLRPWSSSVHEGVLVASVKPPMTGLAMINEVRLE